MTGPPGRRPLRIVLASLLAGVVGVGWAAADLRVVVDPEAPRPGDVVVVRVTGAAGTLTGEWQGRALRFFPARDGLAALVGVDLGTAPGRLSWRLLGLAGAAPPAVVAEGAVTVQARSFPTQRLTLPREQVDLDAATLARVRREQAEMRGALAASRDAPLWAGPFRAPVEDGTPSGGFGLRRIINGQPRSPHAGFDWAAPRGTPVLAANRGRVALVAEHFFAGRLAVVDHGLGLFTLYFHLDETLVARGDRVARGDPLGRVGATGRVTGPHLHFAVLLDGARVDPEALLGLTLPESAEPAPPPLAR